MNKLKRLLDIYVDKVKKHEENEKSWGTKIKNWISKSISFLILGLMIWGFISSNVGSTQSFDPSNE